MKPKYCAVTITGKEIEALMHFWKKTPRVIDRARIVYGFVKSIIRRSKRGIG